MREGLTEIFLKRAEEVVVLTDDVFLQEIELVIDRLEAAVYKDGAPC